MLLFSNFIFRNLGHCLIRIFKSSPSILFSFNSNYNNLINYFLQFQVLLILENFVKISIQYYLGKNEIMKYIFLLLIVGLWLIHLLRLIHQELILLPNLN